MSLYLTILFPLPFWLSFIDCHLKNTNKLNRSAHHHSWSFSLSFTSSIIHLLKTCFFICYLSSNTCICILSFESYIRFQVKSTRKWKLVIQSCPTLYKPMECSSLGSSVHGILQARILEWVAILLGFPGGSVVKTLPAMQETQVLSLGQEDPLEEGVAIHSSTLA